MNQLILRRKMENLRIHHKEKQNGKQQTNKKKLAKNAHKANTKHLTESTPCFSFMHPDSHSTQ